MDDKIQIKDLNLGTPTDTSWLVFQDSDTDVVYKAPKSDIEGHDAYVYIAYADDASGSGFTNTFNASKDYIAILSTDTEIPSPVVGDFAGLWKKYKGETGEKGDAATIQVGTVTTVDPGDPATVVNSGDEHTAVFNFEIPQGEKGACVISVTFVGNDMVFTLEDLSTVTLIGAKSDLKGDTGDTGASIISAAFVGNDIVFTKDDTTKVTLTNGKTILTGPKGDDGDTGDAGRGIVSIEKTNTVGLVDTYTITYTDNTISTFNVTNGEDGIDGKSFTPKGAYNALTEYVANDVVSYLGSTWIALQTTTGNTPQEGAYWTLNAAKGTDGAGAGDMLASVYDPTNVAGDAFDMDNMVEGTNNKLVSAAEKSGWSGKQDALGFTPEDIANKSTNVTTDGASDTKYPSAKAVKDYADGLVAGLLDYRGGYDASSGNYPTTGGSGVAGAVMKGDMWIISVAGTLGGEAVQVGDSIIANIDTPGQTASNWNHLNGNISYVPENVANKENTTLDTSTIKYPTNRLVKEYADSKVEDNIVDGHTTIAPSGNAVFNALALKVPTSRTLTINGTSLDLSADRSWTIQSGVWTAITGTRASNTTITVSGDQTAIFKKGTIVTWKESSVDKVGMVSIPSTYSSPNTTITIIGNTCASIDSSSFKYTNMIGVYKKSFAIAGNIGAVATNVANAWYADKPYAVIGAELSVGTAGTTNNTTIDLNKGGTTMFTTKPTLATTVAFATTPFTADTATALALGDKVTLDIDAVQTTNAIDLYVDLLVFESRYLTLS